MQSIQLYIVHSEHKKHNIVEKMKGDTMNKTYENVAMLYLMNKDLKSLSIEELYELYNDTVKQVKECAIQHSIEKNGSAFSFS